MTTQERLRATVAEFLKITPAAVHPDLPLTGQRLEGSIGRAALDAALRRQLGVHCEAVYSAPTYGQLEAAVLGGPPPPPGPSPATASPGLAATDPRPAPAPAPPGIACGIDIERVDNLPQADDYWADAFYSASFTPTEIAYCALQANPRMHFAVRWCAKEALRKCDNAFLNEPPSAVEVVADGKAPPYFRRAAEGPAQTPLPFALSVSHTPETAIAVVARLTPPGASAPGTDHPPEQASPPPRPASRLWPSLLSAVATALALWALLRTF